MRPFLEDDFPVFARGCLIYCRLDNLPMANCYSSEVAVEIAKRLNRDNQVYPDPEYLPEVAAAMRAKSESLGPQGEGET